MYLFENDNNNASVVFDETTLAEQEKARGITLEALPIAEEIEGKEAVLKCRKSTDEVWYEYRDKPVDEKELEIRISATEEAILALMDMTM